MSDRWRWRLARRLAQLSGWLLRDVEMPPARECEIAITKPENSERGRGRLYFVQESKRWYLVCECFCWLTGSYAEVWFAFCDDDFVKIFKTPIGGI